MNHTEKPPELKVEGDLLENWKFWKQRFELYSVASGLSEKEEKVQCAMLLLTIGDEGLQLYNTFHFTATEKDKIEVLFKKFEEYCIKSKNVIYEMYAFFKTCQTAEQSIDEYVTELERKIQYCGFDNLRNQMLTYAIVAGIRNNRLREELLRNNKLDSEEAVKICRAFEALEGQAKELESNKFKQHMDIEENQYGRRDTSGNG